jgi:peptide methionine sulfoxide reductase MsrA
MTRTNEMTNPQVRTEHRTTAQIAELCLQSAEDYHQQYLNKVPHGYCPDHSTGVSCPVGLNLG